MLISLLSLVFERFMTRRWATVHYSDVFVIELIPNADLPIKDVGNVVVHHGAEVPN